MSNGYSGTRYVKGKKKSGPTLWQIFFSDEEPSKVLSNGTAKTYPVNTRANPFELDEAYSINSSEEEEVDGATANGGVPGSAEKDVIIFERKTETGDQEGRPILDKDYEENNWESMDIKPSGKKKFSFPGKRVLIRTDSDLELALPATGYTKWANSCNYCCVSCPKWPLWKDYIWVVVAALLFLGVWAGILVAILKGLGGQ